MKCMHAALMILAAGSATGANAGDLFALGGVELEYAINRDGPGTSDSLELTTYAELQLAGFYGGAELLLARQKDLHEIDLYLGYRNETASGVGYDVG